jgi:hypothetical protein
MKNVIFFLILLISLAGCNPASLVPSAPVVVADEKEIEKFADEIMPGARPIEGFIAGAGVRSSDMKFVAMPNALSFGEEYRMTIFLIGLPAHLPDEKAEARAQDTIMKYLGKRGWGVTSEGTETIAAGAVSWVFKKNGIATEDTGKFKVMQYIIVKKQKNHKAVIVVQGLPNVMNRKALEAFLGGLRS